MLIGEVANFMTGRAKRVDRWNKLPISSKFLSSLFLCCEMERKQKRSGSRFKRRNPKGEAAISEPHAKRQKIQPSHIDSGVPFGLDQLPCELHQQISLHLPFKTMIRLNEVCRFWKSSTDDVTFWRGLYTREFGPLSEVHLTLPVPSTLQHPSTGPSGLLPTPPAVLRWKKRCCLMRRLRSNRGALPRCCIFLGCAVIVRDLEHAEEAILINDMDALQETLQNIPKQV